MGYEKQFTWAEQSSFGWLTAYLWLAFRLTPVVFVALVRPFFVLRTPERGIHRGSQRAIGVTGNDHTPGE